jgi:hypothetical protein
MRFLAPKKLFLNLSHFQFLIQSTLLRRASMLYTYNSNMANNRINYVTFPHLRSATYLLLAVDHNVAVLCVEEFQAWRKSNTSA